MSTPASMFAGGLALGVLLGVGGMFGYSTYLAAAPEDCGGGELCGEGTVCQAGRCQLAVAEAEVVEEAEAPEPGSKRKRRRGKRGSRGGGAGGELAGDGGPPLDNDAKVPRFDPNKDQSISMSDGSGRLSDAQIDRELAKLDSAFQACVRDAAARVPDISSGTVRYSFGVDGKGKVTGVNASAPAKLTDAGIIPCVRKSVYGHKFPAFNGPEMKVSSSFTVD